MTGATMAAAIACTLAVAIAAGARGQPTGGDRDDGRPTTTTTTATTTTTGPTAAAEDLGRRPFDGTADGSNNVMWKRCMSKDYATCVGLALAHLVDRLRVTNDSYPLAPGVTVSASKAADHPGAKTDDRRDGPSAGRDPSETFDRLLVDKLGRYFGALTLNVKLLDDATVRSVRELSEAASIQSGRGKKQKYAQSILLAGWVTGAMLLALGMKTIAVLAGKALMTALMSLLLSALTSFRGHGHSEPKSTTYEIVTKPVYSHSHATAEDVHAAGTQNNPTYRRSIGGAAAAALQHVATPSASEEADHVVYRIHASDQTPIYIPIERR